MKIYAKIKITWVNETEKKKILKLVNKSEEGKLPFNTLKLFPSQLRFGDRFDISNPRPSIYEFGFEIYSIADGQNK